MPNKFFLVFFAVGSPFLAWSLKIDQGTATVMVGLLAALAIDAALPEVRAALAPVPPVQVVARRPQGRP